MNDLRLGETPERRLSCCFLGRTQGYATRTLLAVLGSPMSLIQLRHFIARRKTDEQRDIHLVRTVTSSIEYNDPLVIIAQASSGNMAYHM